MSTTLHAVRVHRLQVKLVNTGCEHDHTPPQGSRDPRAYVDIRFHHVQRLFVECQGGGAIGNRQVRSALINEALRTIGCGAKRRKKCMARLKAGLPARRVWDVR